MILRGFLCPNCNSQVIDSVVACYNCGLPYTGLLAQAAQAHHEAKLTLVSGGKDKTKEDILLNVLHLASASESLAVSEELGVKGIPNRVLTELFQKT